jgi:O-antigen/teichoic acid export membrane protein
MKLQQIRSSTETLFLGESLQAKVFRGGAWLGGGSFAEQVVRFGRNMLLARILAPEAFGTMAIILSACSAIQSFTDLGIREAVIQSPKGGEPQYIEAAWWLALFRALAIYTFFFLAAPLLSQFYGDSELAGLLRVAALAVLFEGASSPKAYVAIKEMNFKKFAAIQHGGGILGVLITIVLSFVVRDVWALVIGYCSEGLFRCLLSYVLCPFVPGLRWDKTAGGELFGFSKSLLGLSFLNFIFMRTDIFVLGKLFSAAELGIYALAIYLVQTPTTFLMNLLGQTLLPTHAQIQADTERMNRILLQVTSLIILLGLPALGFVFFCGDSLLTIAYGEPYSAAVVPLVVASFVSLINVANGQITIAFYAKGLPQLHRYSVTLMAATMIALTYPLAKLLGVAGGQVACLIAVIVGFSFQLVRIRRLTGLDLTRPIKMFALSTAVTIGVVTLGMFVRSFAAIVRPMPTVLIGVVSVLMAYWLSLVVFFRSNQKETALSG